MGILFQQEWQIISKRIGISIIVPFILTFFDGSEQIYDVLLKYFGAKNGMILVSDYSLIEHRDREIIELGYGFSCLSEPTERRIEELIKMTDGELIDSYKEMLEDWSYCGEPEYKPKWIDSDM